MQLGTNWKAVNECVCLCVRALSLLTCENENNERTRLPPLSQATTESDNKLDFYYRTEVLGPVHRHDTKVHIYTRKKYSSGMQCQQMSTSVNEGQI